MTNAELQEGLDTGTIHTDCPICCNDGDFVVSDAGGVVCGACGWNLGTPKQPEPPTTIKAPAFLPGTYEEKWDMEQDEAAARAAARQRLARAEERFLTEDYCWGRVYI